MSAIDQTLLSRLYLGEIRPYRMEIIELAHVCCNRHDLKVCSGFTDGRAAEAEIDTYYSEAARLGFEGSAVMWRRYVVGMREKV